MKLTMVWLGAAVLVLQMTAVADVESKLTAVGHHDRAVIELQNDNYDPAGAPVYLQQGFITGEKVGVWVKVPAGVKKFKVDYFRVLFGAARGSAPSRTQVFFEMGVAGANQFSPSMPVEIVNAASITPGPYWNDIPATGADGRSLSCAKGGDLVGAALEFTQDGTPSVYRDTDGMSNPKANTLMAIPGGWNYSVAYGLQGDWVLRVMGHEAAAGECP